MILAICASVDVSKCLDLLIWEFWAIWETSSIFTPERMLIRRQLLVQHNLVVLQWHPLLLLWGADEPCSAKTAWAPESSFTMSPRNRTRPLYFSSFGSNSAFLRWQMIINEATWTSFVPLCASRKTSLFVLNFVQLPSWIRFELFPFFVHCCFRIRYFHRLRHRKTCEPRCSVSSNNILCLRGDLHDLSVEMMPNVVSWTREPPRCMHAFVWILDGFKTLRFSFLKAEELQGIAASIGYSNFLLAFLMVSSCSFSIFWDEINASQPSSIVEFWLLVCPSLLFSLLWHFPCVLWKFVPNHFDQCPRWNLFGFRNTVQWISMPCPINVVEHRHEENYFFKLFWILVVELPDLSGFVWESQSMWILGTYSTRTQLVLHQFQTTLRTRWIVESHWSDLSMSHSLLKGHASFPDTKLNLSRHVHLLSPTWLLDHYTQ